MGMVEVLVAALHAHAACESAVAEICFTFTYLTGAALPSACVTHPSSRPHGRGGAAGAGTVHPASPHAACRLRAPRHGRQSGRLRELDLHLSVRRRR